MIRNSIIFLSLFFPLQKSSCQINKAFDCSTCSSGDSSIVQKISKMTFKKYQGKEVKDFLDDLNYAYIEYIPIMGKPGYIQRIMFVYSDSVSIEIEVSDLVQTKPLGFGYTFNVDDYRRNKISMICFRYAGRCIKGCKEQICYQKLMPARTISALFEEGETV